MRRLFFHPESGLIVNSQLVYWLSLALFGVVIVTTFLIFETHIQQALLAINNTLQTDFLSRITIILLLISLLAFDALLPVPSSIVALMAVSTLGAVLGSLVIFIGLCLGAVLGYLLGTGWLHIMASWFKPSERQRATHYSTALTSGALFFLRGVPVLAETSVIAAGIARYPLKRFLLITSLANLVLACVYGYLGSTLVGS